MTKSGPKNGEYLIAFKSSNIPFIPLIIVKFHHVVDVFFSLFRFVSLHFTSQ